ncbi:MAG: hypothetical protein DRP45_01755, partial [Candidatus Zixiibacteriota bacterium]
MQRACVIVLVFITVGFCTSSAVAQFEDFEDDVQTHTLYDMPPRQLVDVPTAGTLTKGHFDLALRLYANGGALAYTDIGLSNRLMIGVSYGGTETVSDRDPDWNPRIGFSLKFRLIDELEYFPGVAIGYSDQGYGAWHGDMERFDFKSRGFYAVTSRSFYFYKWTAGWHV